MMINFWYQINQKGLSNWISPPFSCSRKCSIFYRRPLGITRYILESSPSNLGSRSLIIEYQRINSHRHYLLPPVEFNIIVWWSLCLMILPLGGARLQLIRWYALWWCYGPDLTRGFTSSNNRSVAMEVLFRLFTAMITACVSTRFKTIVIEMQFIRIRWWSNSIWFVNMLPIDLNQCSGINHSITSINLALHTLINSIYIYTHWK